MVVGDDFWRVFCTMGRRCRNSNGFRGGGRLCFHVDVLEIGACDASVLSLCCFCCFRKNVKKCYGNALDVVRGCIKICIKYVDAE